MTPIKIFLYTLVFAPYIILGQDRIDTTNLIVEGISKSRSQLKLLEIDVLNEPLPFYFVEVDDKILPISMRNTVDSDEFKVVFTTEAELLYFKIREYIQILDISFQSEFGYIEFNSKKLLNVPGHYRGCMRFRKKDGNWVFIDTKLKI